VDFTCCILHFTYYHDQIAPDDEESANRWKRNRCEYLKRGVRGSLGVFRRRVSSWHARKEKRNKKQKHPKKKEKKRLSSIEKNHPDN
jgi:hypothetical protein